MDVLWILRAACFVLAFFLLRGFFLLLQIRLSRLRGSRHALAAAQRSSATPLRTMLILGSGGHTAEMISLCREMDREQFRPLIYVRAQTDSSSLPRVQRTEAEKQNEANCVHVSIPRSREVGQSYVGSVWTTLVAFAAAMRIVWQQRPQVLLCNGPGTGVPLCVVAFLLKVFLFRPCLLVFIESFCRVQSLSMSGILLYPIVDEFVVQWPQLDAEQEKQKQKHKQRAADPAGQQGEPRNRGWKGVKYIGRLC